MQYKAVVSQYLLPVVTFECMDEQYFPMVLFTMLYKVVYEIVNCDHSNEHYLAVVLFICKGIRTYLCILQRFVNILRNSCVVFPVIDKSFSKQNQENYKLQLNF